MADYKNNSELVELLLRWWKQLIGIAIVALVLSTIFSSDFIITPKFRSFAVIYPSNIIPMGEETPTEQMLQVLEADNIRDTVISLHHLYEEYRIDRDGISAESAIIKEYQDNVIFKKTEYESVIVEVLHSDPKEAYGIVKSIIFFFNLKERTLQKEKAMELVKILETQVNNKRVEMDSMEAVLTSIRLNYGILDYSLQTEYATERYLEMVSTPSMRANAKDIEPLLNALKEKGGEFLALSEHLWRVRGGYNDLKEQLEAAVRDVEKNLTYCSVITNPVVSDEKAYPIRWLIVAVSVLSTLLLSILFLGIMENLRSSSEN